MTLKIKGKYLLSVVLIIPGIGVAGNIINDSFETGDMSSPGNPDFQWGKNNRTSIVTMNPGNTEVYNNGNLHNDVSDGRDWTAYDGEYSLRFRYPAGSEWAEQRFDIGEAHDDLWMSFWLRVPTNFYHQSPEGIGLNHKLMALWMDGYSNKGDGGNVVMEYRPDRNGGSSFYVKVGSGRYTVTGRDQGYVPFISVPEDRGRWMHLVIHVVAESSEDASDGIVEVWRKWEGEEYRKTHDLSGQPIRLPESGPQGFRRGYLMGWANATFAENTEFLIDKFQLSTESLLSTTSRPNSLTNGHAP